MFIIKLDRFIGFMICCEYENFVASVSRKERLYGFKIFFTSSSEFIFISLF